MIKGKLTRIHFGNKCTIGNFALYDNSGSEVFTCFVCEDVLRGGGDSKTVSQWKVKGESAIPYGTYKVALTFSPKYSTLYHPNKKWEVKDVPGFQGIRIHSGNTEKDTEGCLLFGEFISPNYTGVQNSKKAVETFETLMNSIGNPEWEITIEAAQ